MNKRLTRKEEKMMFAVLKDIQVLKDMQVPGCSHNKIVYHNCAHTLQDLRSLEDKGILTLKLKKKDENRRNTKYKCVHVEFTLVGETLARCLKIDK